MRIGQLHFNFVDAFSDQESVLHQTVTAYPRELSLKIGEPITVKVSVDLSETVARHTSVSNLCKVDYKGRALTADSVKTLQESMQTVTKPVLERVQQRFQRLRTGQTQPADVFDQYFEEKSGSTSGNSRR